MVLWPRAHCAHNYPPCLCVCVCALLVCSSSIKPKAAANPFSARPLPMASGCARLIRKRTPNTHTHAHIHKHRTCVNERSDLLLTMAKTCWWVMCSSLCVVTALYVTAMWMTVFVCCYTAHLHVRPSAPWFSSIYSIYTLCTDTHTQHTILIVQLVLSKPHTLPLFYALNSQARACYVYMLCTNCAHGSAAAAALYSPILCVCAGYVRTHNYGKFMWWGEQSRLRGNMHTFKCILYIICTRYMLTVFADCWGTNLFECVCVSVHFACSQI